MEFVPNAKKRQAINTLDTNGETPLRLSAMSGMFSGTCPEIHLQTCQKTIIELGGDKNLPGSTGLTALGKFQKI
jgi:hypothetical protein